MATKQATTKETSIDVIAVSQGVVEYHLLGTTPLIMNRLAEKARHELLLPSGRKNAAQRASTLKHDPLAEYRAAAHLMEGDLGPTLLGIPGVAFKKAMATAALDLPGTNKSQLNRLIYIEGDKVNVWGVPELFMTVVRSADMNRTPDIRSRPILPRWACSIRVRYTQPLIKPEGITNLLVAAGFNVGVLDFRQEKGAGNYGLWSIVSADDPEYQDVIASGGRAAQQAGYDTPSCYDRDTADLLAWYEEELDGRRAKGVA